MKASIIEEAVSLPSDKRAELVDILMQSLNTTQDLSCDKLWIKEAEKRYNDLKAGSLTPVSAEEVFNSIRKRFFV
jgi:putative addiction module component (TIGR02574 family)